MRVKVMLGVWGLCALLLLGQDVKVSALPDKMPLGDDQRTSPALVPWPQKVEQQKGDLVLKDGALLAVNDVKLKPLAQILRDELQQTLGVKLAVTQASTPPPGGIFLALEPRLKADCYEIVVDKTAIVRGGAYGAVALGSVTLVQAAVKGSSGATLAFMRISDQADCAYRGVLLDLARRYHDLASIKQTINLCRMYKINYMQLHLTDDQAFMFPTPSFPKAWAKENIHNGAPRAYTLAELRELVAYADERHVTLIPEFDVPGHSAALNRSDKDFWMIRGTRPHEHHASINFAKEEVIAACCTIIDEMCDVFKSSPYFHIGGDEADYALAHQNEHFIKAMTEHGVKYPHGLYLRFLNRLNECVKKNGKRTIVWEGFSRGDAKTKFPIPKDVIVMVYENRFYQANHLVSDGYTIINASWTPLYVMRVLEQYTPKIYDWNLYLFGAFTKDFTKTKWRQMPPHNLVLGAQCCAWEQPQASEVSHLRWPLAAMSERVWHMAAARSYQNFYTRLQSTDSKLERMLHKVHFEAKSLINFEDRIFDGSMSVAMRAEEAGSIHYTLNGESPSYTSAKYMQPLKITRKTVVRAALFDATGHQVGAQTEEIYFPVKRAEKMGAITEEARAEWQTAEISGKVVNPNEKYGSKMHYTLGGDAEMGWQTKEILGDIDLNGHSLVMETGGGNRTVFAGAVTGVGNFTWLGGSVPQVGASILQGSAPNTFQGTFTLAKGVLDLNKTASVEAVPGTVMIGTRDKAVVRLKQNQQFSHKTQMVIGPHGPSGLELNGKQTKFASLVIQGDAFIDCGSQPSTLLVGACTQCQWDLQRDLLILNFKQSDKIQFGTDASALLPEQLKRIGFKNPAGHAAGLYSARLDPAGYLLPYRAIAAHNPPFDISRQAVERRRREYGKYDGALARLVGQETPIKRALTISFFGDSLTWQNTFVKRIQKGLAEGSGTKDRAIKVVNRGINGGGVCQIRDGVDKAAFPGNSPQESFKALLAADKPDLAVILIGVNDVGWRETSAETFKKGLHDLAQSAQSANVRLVFISPTVHGELPDGSNPLDAKMDEYVAMMAESARATGAFFINARALFKAYLMNHNADITVDGGLFMKTTGVLTYDGIHPNQEGVKLLTQIVAGGILEALE